MYSGIHHARDPSDSNVTLVPVLFVSSIALVKLKDEYVLCCYIKGGTEIKSHTFGITLVQGQPHVRIVTFICSDRGSS
jgi:hypothetical protein